MGAALSVFRATTGAPIGTTREFGGADDTAVSHTGATLPGDTQGGTQGGTPATVQQQQQQPTEYIDQCGIGPDWDSLPPYKPPPRITKSHLTPEERAKFQGHVDLIFSEKTIMGRRIVFDPDDVMEVLIKVKEYLKSETMLIEDVPVGITVVGDLLGQLYDLDRVFQSDAKDGKPGWECMKYLFLGNYVGRGRQSIEIIMALFCLKCLYPDRIFLLRGDHEFFAETNKKDGFSWDFRLRYEFETAVFLFAAAHETFCYLSVAAIIDNAYLCVHGGISARCTRQQMRGVLKPFTATGDDLLVQDIVFSEPAQGLTGLAFNSDRGISCFYGFDTLCHALDCMEVLIVIRGHTKLQTGYEIAWKCLFSIFSATASNGDNNDGAVAVINEQGKISIKVLAVNPERTAWEQRLINGARGEMARDHN